MHYDIVLTSEFKISLKRMKKQNKDMTEINYVVNKLASDKPLESKYRNHKLRDSKKFKNCWECHIESDWLLIYKKLIDKVVLVLVDTGSHSDLFK